MKTRQFTPLWEKCPFDHRLRGPLWGRVYPRMRRQIQDRIRG
ncbi:hypothetical protein YSA_06067 [Pseudomonas putida ND6]|uniref:Uncharacterized protein n=1 Tax=Pseudomonas putida ND6 TaxID=231023 RepID=I3UX31_PSEPU|nr:hypothetical protein YSA_06067 [Pseudomonas putida ND6]